MGVGKLQQAIEWHVKLWIGNDDTDKTTDKNFVFILFNKMNIRQNV
jgi:hypothetical protein